MSSRAVKKAHRRNPSQHRVLASILDQMNQDKKWHEPAIQKRQVPIVMEVSKDEEENQRHGRPEKRVTWSRELQQVRRISPRRKSPKSSRPARAQQVHTDAGQRVREVLGQEAGDCGHFLCQRMGRGCLQGDQGHQGVFPSQSHQGVFPSQDPQGVFPSLPCSPQMQAVMWRSSPYSRAGLSLDLANSFIQGEGLV